MDFDQMVLQILDDERVKRIPILYIIQVLICVDDLLENE